MPKKNYLKLNNIYKSKLLFQNKVFFCQIGKFGLTQFYSKKEGDLKTPRGKWEIGKFFYKKSSINYFKINRSYKKKLINISYDHIWCDDIESYYYNKLLKKSKLSKTNIGSFESLFRNDGAYDIIIEIKSNNKPIIKNKGSAIFLHCSFSDLRPTKGCVALKKNDLKYIISHLQSEKYIYIG